MSNDEEWKKSCNDTLLRMMDHVEPFITPIWKYKSEDESNLKLNGSGSYFENLHCQFIVKNEHVAKYNLTNRLTHSFKESQDVLNIHNSFLSEGHPIDVAIGKIDSETWQKHKCQGEAIPIKRFANWHFPVEGELLFFVGFSGERSNIVFDNCFSRGTPFLTQVCTTSENVEEANLFYHLSIPYPPILAESADNTILFSQADKQLGREDDRGTLFDEIVKIHEFRKPTFFILKNVPFIAKYDNEATWEFMQSELDRICYKVDHNIYSHQLFGIPQHRKRIFIVGSKIGLAHFRFDKVDNRKFSKIDIHKFIEVEPADAKKSPKSNQYCLKLWQEFISNIPKDVKLPGSPIWGMEFGATYPFVDEFPHLFSAIELSKFKGKFGISIKGMTKDVQLVHLPSFARVETKFPDWKQRYIKYNRQFYKENKSYVENVVKRISELPSQSWQKIEWNVGDNKRKITDYILQFRALGIRICIADFFPSFVCTNTQIPIIGWEIRYISRIEGLQIQFLSGIKIPENDYAAFKALGNAVNYQIAELIAKQLIIYPNDLPHTMPKMMNGNKVT